MRKKQLLVELKIVLVNLKIDLKMRNRKMGNRGNGRERVMESFSRGIARAVRFINN